MPVYSVSYDLIKRKNYPELIAELKRLKAKRILLSQWCVRLPASNASVELRDHLKRHIDSDDRLAVFEIHNEWATFNATFDLNKV